MYHNSATPPLPACYGDTCEPHQSLNMLSHTVEYIDVYRYIDIDVYRWSPYDDTTLTAYLPPSGCRIVHRNRCPPNHPVVGMTSGISDKRINIVATCDITAHTVLLYVLFYLIYMYCTLYVHTYCTLYT